jgi:two-component system, sporulation sensor kinase E
MQYSKNYEDRDIPAEVKGKAADGEERYRCLFEQATDLIVIHDLDGVIVNVNDSLCSRVGYTKEELLSMNFSELIDPEQLKVIPLRMKELRDGKRIFSERRYKCKDGSIVEIEANVKKMSDGLVMGVCRDVTVRKQMERELREAELKFRTISEKSLVGIYIIQDGKFAYVNPKFAEIFGYTPPEMTDSFPVENIVDEKDKTRVSENIRARMAGELQSVHFEAKGRKKDGTPIYTEVFGSRSEYKGRTAIIGSLIDITERRQAEEQILKERNLSNEIIDCLPGVFFLQDKDGRYLRWNKHFGKASGYSEEELKHLKALDFFEGHQRDVVQEKIREMMANPNLEADLETEIVTKDGRKVPFYYKGKHIEYEGEPCIIGTGMNITRLRKVQEELKKSEANLQTILDNTDTVYLLLDSGLRILSYNQRAIDFATRELGHKMQISDHILDHFPAGRRQALTKWMAKAIKGENIHYEISYPQPDGSFTWYYVRMFQVKNAKQEVLGIMMAVSDVTRQKLLEQQILDQKVQEQKKITRVVITVQEKERNKIGQELHDNVNQILASAGMYARTWLDNESQERTLIEESARLIKVAIEEIRLLSRNEITPQRTLSLRDLIQPLVDHLNDNSSIKARLDFHVAGRQIDADLKLNVYRIVQEQLNNILKHAIASQVYILLAIGEGYLRLSIVDDGKGFDTTRKRKGIGLTNIANRVESFNGDLSIDSSVGEGCRLSIRIPV